MARTVIEIGHDIDATQARLAKLFRERDAVIAGRDETILAAFDAGDSAKIIAARLGENVATVNGVIYRNGRSVAKRRAPISHLPADQQRLYHKLRREGIGPKTARAMATVPPAHAGVAQAVTT